MSAKGSDLPFGIDFGGSGIKGAPSTWTRASSPRSGCGSTPRSRRRRRPWPRSSPSCWGSFDDSTARSASPCPPSWCTASSTRRPTSTRRWIGDGRRQALHRAHRPRRARGQRRRRGRPRRGAVRRGAGPQRPGHRHHARHRDRLRPGVRRRAGAELRARPPRDRRPRRREAGRLQRPRERGPVLGGVGQAADDVLPHARGAVLPRAVRRRRRRQQEGRQVPAADRHRHRDRPRRPCSTPPASSAPRSTPPRARTDPHRSHDRRHRRGVS